MRDVGAARLRVGPGGGSESSRCVPLRGTSLPVLGLAARCETRFANFVRSAQTVAASQCTKRAVPARGRKSSAPQASRYSPPPGPTRSLAAPLAVWGQTSVRPARAGDGWGRGRCEWRGSREAQHTWPRAAGAQRGLTRRDCLSGAHASERSEFRGGPGGRASQGTEREALRTSRAIERRPRPHPAPALAARPQQAYR